MSWRSKTYDELPALSVRGPELRSSLRTVTVAWMYGIVWMACISASHVPLFGKRIGFTEYHFGLMGAIPFVATFAQLFAALIIERTGLRKYQFTDCATVHRLMWIPIALVPLVLPWGSSACIYSVLGLLLASWFLESMARPAWLTWMGDLIPRRIRGRYFAIRGRITQGFQIIAVIMLGLLIDHDWAIFSWGAGLLGLSMPVHTTVNIGRMQVYTICGVFIVAAFFGARDILLFRRLRDVLPSIKTPPAPVEHEHRNIFSYLKYMLYDPLKERVFRHYVGYAATMTFTMTLSGIFFWRHSMDGLGFNLLATNLAFMVIGPLADMTSAPVWGRLIDRYGRRPILIIATCGTTFSIMPWLFARPDTPCPASIAAGINWICSGMWWVFGQQWHGLDPSWPVGAYLLAAMGCVIGGVSWSGVGLAQMGVMLGFADGSGRSRAVAASGVLISMGGVIGGYVGGVVTQALVGRTLVDWGPILWTNYHVVFIGTIVVRVLSIGWLLGMPDGDARPVWAVLTALKANFLNGVQSRAFLPLRVFGWGKPADNDHPGDSHNGQEPHQQANASPDRDRGKD